MSRQPYSGPLDITPEERIAYTKQVFSLGPTSYKEVPGFINDAVFIYGDWIEEMKERKAGESLKAVEVGTYLGQSAVHMCSLIKESGLDVSFDSIDLFHTLYALYVSESHPDTIKVGWDEARLAGIPPSFVDYFKLLRDTCIENASHIIFPIDVSTHPLRSMNLDHLCNLITCDSKYASNIYEDESIDLLYLDGDHSKEAVLGELTTFWPKIVEGGILAGDDYNLEGVQDALFDFMQGRTDVELVAENYVSFVLRKIG